MASMTCELPDRAQVETCALRASESATSAIAVADTAEQQDDDQQEQQDGEHASGSPRGACAIHARERARGSSRPQDDVEELELLPSAEPLAFGADDCPSCSCASRSGLSFCSCAGSSFGVN